MIEINLLPDEFKKAQKRAPSLKFEAAKFGPKLFKIAAYFLAGLAALHVLLCLSVLLKSISLKSLDSKWQDLQPEKMVTDRLNSEIAAIEKTVLPIRQLVEKRCMWSKKLNQLSDLLTPGVWFTRLYTQTQAKDAKKGGSITTMELEGYAASLYGDETALIGNFIKGLQENGEFNQDFSEIKLGTMEKEELDKDRVMRFKLSCFFR